MNTDERLGTFEAILKPHGREVREIARALRNLIGTLHPGAVETPRLGEATSPAIRNLVLAAIKERTLLSPP
jgi:hypothetical protein